ncbi:MAG TPA: pyridoxamine 5'-phosphate oxidase family protein [Cytophagaceae bacterium]|jgi:general stress protein 26
METCKNYVALHDKIKNIKIAMMTLNEYGKMKSFPLPTVQTECEGYMWFFVNMDAERLQELNSHPEANVSFSDGKTFTYVSVTGTVEVCRDRNKMEELWKPNLEEILKANLSSSQIVLIKHNVDFAEYWDSQTGYMKDIWHIEHAPLNR